MAGDLSGDVTSVKAGSICSLVAISLVVIERLSRIFMQRDEWS
jgi:hypothetical protein